MKDEKHAQTFQVLASAACSSSARDLPVALEGNMKIKQQREGERETERERVRAAGRISLALQLAICRGEFLRQRHRHGQMPACLPG